MSFALPVCLLLFFYFFVFVFVFLFFFSFSSCFFCFFFATLNHSLYSHVVSLLYNAIQ